MGRKQVASRENVAVKSSKDRGVEVLGGLHMQKQDVRNMKEEKKAGKEELGVA